MSTNLIDPMLASNGTGAIVTTATTAADITKFALPFIGATCSDEPSLSSLLSNCFRMQGAPGVPRFRMQGAPGVPRGDRRHQAIAIQDVIAEAIAVTDHDFQSEDTGNG